MRLSVDSTDPGHRAYRALPARVCPLVTLDGREVRNVITADDRLGYVLAYKLDAEGRPMLNAQRTQIVRQQLRGRVAIELVRRAG